MLGLDPATQARDLRRRIWCQLQESALPARIRVREALDLFASLAPRKVDWRVLMEQWGPAEKEHAAFSSLSGGRRQRLFVALALVNDPEVVFLVEMTTGLDPAARRVAWDLIRAIREGGATVVLVTHFMDEAERLCDRIGVMTRGTLVAMDTPQGSSTRTPRRSRSSSTRTLPIPRASRICRAFDASAASVVGSRSREPTRCSRWWRRRSSSGGSRRGICAWSSRSWRTYS